MAEKINRDRVKPRLARAWFDTVLNPMIRGLKTEFDLINRGDFTWRMHNRRFAALVPIREYIGAGDLDNLDQFLSVFPDVARMMSDHDDKLQVLGTCVSEFFRTLIGHPAFIKALRDLNIQGAGADPDPIADYAAEYVINNVGHLPSYYSTAQFWNTHGTEFLELLGRTGIRESWELVASARSDFEWAIKQLVAALTSVRSELSFELDVPIVDSVAS